VACGMSYVMLRCYVGWLRLSLCATWHGLGLTYVTCPMPCLNVTWHSLDLTYVPCGMFMLCLNAMWDGLDLGYVPHGMA
jgi:hypothetical protein